MFASVNLSATDVVVAAPGAGKRIRLLAYTLISYGTVNVKWQSNVTDLCGALPLVVNSGLSPAFCPFGLMRCAVNEPLKLNLSGSIQVTGHITYVIESANS